MTILKNVFLKADRLLPLSIGNGPRLGKVRLRVFVVDVVGLLGLVLDRLVLAVLGILHLEDLNVDLGFAVDHVQVARRLDLELLDFEEDGDVGIEVAGRVGRIGPVGMGFHPGRDLVGLDDRDLLDFLLARSRQLAGNVAFQRREFRERARGHVTQNDDLLLLERGPFRLDRGIERLEEIGQRPRVATR